jgi:hypothetical protein
MIINFYLISYFYLKVEVFLYTFNYKLNFDTKDEMLLHHYHPMQFIDILWNHVDIIPKYIKPVENKYYTIKSTYLLLI